MDPETLSAVGTVGSGVLNTILGGVQTAVSVNENKKNREWQEKMYQQQLADSRQDWQRDADFQRELIASEREYNKMSNQVKRAVEAGVNPNTLVGGSFNSAGASSVTPPGSRSADIPTLSGYNSPSVIPIQNGLNALQAGVLQASQLDIARRDQEIKRDVASADIKLKLAQTLESVSKAQNIDTDTLAKKIENDFRRDRLKSEIDNIKSETLLNQTRMRNIAEDTLSKYFQRVNILPKQAELIQNEISIAFNRAQMIGEQLDYFSSVRPWRESSEYSRHMLDFYATEQARFIDDMKPLREKLLELAKTKAEKEIAMMTFNAIMNSLNTLFHGASVAASFRSGKSGSGSYVYDANMGQGYDNYSPLFMD